MTANTPRGRVSPQRRQAIFSENCTAHNIAPCCLCGEPSHSPLDQLHGGPFALGPCTGQASDIKISAAR
jgi:hypothetical protein